MGEPRLSGKVALVTGASRGGGKGIAVVLGEQGATVYVTGRSVRGQPTTLDRPGTIDDTAELLTARGGTGIAVRCDHTDDAQVEALFDRIRKEQGRLDVLVNNAWSGYEISPDSSLDFWEIEWRHWDLMFTGGLRATAFASTLAAPMMIEAGGGLIVNVTWVLDRPHGHAFYEVVKNATNKLTEQMADDLRPHGIACIAVSPGFMRLERMDLTQEEAAKAESAEFPGRAIAALAADDKVLAKSGRVFTTPELAREYGFTDLDGKQQSAFWEEHWAGTWA
ncbi:MAG TPA: SDR family NAD(P)-dependent oxidoreductase [Actinomycetota bacterium]|jgi:NAD(P)-dependent dehydrogenase (short-subunit alcohol dehydrogenase family)|nr:SDR family NAD(P)-dependent oxidoreductase [Actinomycetota bacterium]